MHFAYIRNAALPDLAWAIRMTSANPSVEVIHGIGVETHDTFFVEGAWRGTFKDGSLDQSDVLLGSGARLEADKLIVASATHTLERLHSMRTGSKLYFSNSLALILALASDDLRDDYASYDIDLLSFVEGVPGAATTIPTQTGSSVFLHYCQNIVVDSELTVVELPKPDHLARPQSYSEYADFLNTVTKEIAANARAAERTFGYTPLATVSSGYDSPACAILARSVGADDAVTFSNSRPGFEHDDDSGVEIGKRLGFKVVEYNRTDYMKRTDLTEAEFLASGTGGEDVVLAALEPVLPGRVLFTGYRGDALWGLHGNPGHSMRYRMKDPSGASISEFRLRAGFIHFPVPQSHHRMHRFLHNISHSAEMAPWRRGGSYDRPIPRRMIENEDVPGDWFGRTKKAITQPFYHGDPLETMLSEAAREKLQSYCLKRNIRMENRSPPLLPLYKFANEVTWHMPAFRSTAWRFLRKAWLNPNAIVTSWAIRHLRDKYATALKVV